ncbi:MAG: hypothetical protein R2839_06615 [Thermomicrobiales bacterium]
MLHFLALILVAIALMLVVLEGVFRDRAAYYRIGAGVEAKATSNAAAWLAEVSFPPVRVECDHDGYCRAACGAHLVVSASTGSVATNSAESAQRR